MGLGDELRNLLESQQARDDEVQRIYQGLCEEGLFGQNQILRLRTGVVRCRRGCTLATAFRYDGADYLAVEDYKLSTTLNLQRSVESARQRNTLDGDRHWPGHVFHLQEFAENGPLAGMHVACSHTTTSVSAADVLQHIAGAKPGKSGNPLLV